MGFLTAGARRVLIIAVAGAVLNRTRRSGHNDYKLKPFNITVITLFCVLCGAGNPWQPSHGSESRRPGVCARHPVTKSFLACTLSFVRSESKYLKHSFMCTSCVSWFHGPREVTDVNVVRLNCVLASPTLDPESPTHRY